MVGSSTTVRRMTSQDEKALRLLAGRALHRPTDLGMKEVAALASAVIGFLEPAKSDEAQAKTR